MNLQLRTFFICLLPFHVGACATQSVSNGLNAMLGQPVQTAFSVLGYPDGKQTFGGDDVYVWDHSRTGGMLLPQASTTYQTYGGTSVYGTVGTTPVYGTMSPQTVTSTTLYNQYVPMHGEFTIKIAADSKTGTIKNWQTSGNEMGAQAFAGVLAAYSKSRSTSASQQVSGHPFVQEVGAKKIDKGTLQRVAAGRVVGVEDMKNMLRGGVPNEKIVAYLKATKTPYMLNEIQLKSLRSAGANRTLITYLEKANAMHGTGRGSELSHPYYSDPYYSGAAPFRFSYPEA
jgi:hypothetical protein